MIFLEKWKESIFLEFDDVRILQKPISFQTPQGLQGVYVLPHEDVQKLMLADPDFDWAQVMRTGMYKVERTSAWLSYAKVDDYFEDNHLGRPHFKMIEGRGKKNNFWKHEKTVSLKFSLYCSIIQICKNL